MYGVPSSGHFSTMTFGIWSPGSLSVLSEQELTIAKQLSLPDAAGPGYFLAGSVPGQRGSSTRAELAGGIVALLQPRPIHIGTDSEAFLTRALEIIESPLISPRKPFALQKDGDLWHLFTKLVTERGPSSVNISWSKAHVSLHAIASGQVASEHAVANSFADWAAAQANKALNRQPLIDFFAYLHEKRDAFINLLVDINLLVLRVLDADRDLRTQARNSSASMLGINRSKPQPVLLATTYV